MKRLIFFITLIVLSACGNTNRPSENQSGLKMVNAPEKTTNKFLWYIKSNKINEAIQLIHSTDSNASLKDNQYIINSEYKEINDALKAINSYGINDSTWKEQTKMVDSKLYYTVYAYTNQPTTDPLTENQILWGFLIHGTDTTLTNFVFSSTRFVKENPQTKIADKFIDYLKNGKREQAFQMLDNIEFDDIAESQHREIDTAAIALNLYGINTVKWANDTLTSGGVLCYIIAANFNSTKNDRFGNCQLSFNFAIKGNDTTLSFVDFYDHL